MLDSDVLRSLEAEKWLAEDDFELTQDFPQAKVARQAREEAAPSEYRSVLFEKAGPIFVSHVCTPPRSQLITLLRLSGAKVTDSVHRAYLYIGDESHADKTSVKPLWVLDCISHQELLPLDDYILSDSYKPKTSKSPEF
ncbi:hypothetical protein BaRGS_00016834 [Batillaria attramentaria]|uniref:BRCT domain-containing protein n=1 Tax=Batillaria attramentaria TaxID=370345 RepID=A0ABD0KYG3_9CAEN